MINLISIKISGINELINKAKQSSNPKMYSNSLKQMGENAIKYAKMYAPEDTGIMADDIQGHIEGDEFIMECLVPWATFNEYGSMYMKVGTPNSPLAVISTNGKYAFRPFMRPAMYRARDEFPELFHEKWARIWK